MICLEFDNVNDVYRDGLQWLRSLGKRAQSRAGEVLAIDSPVTITYRNPTYRVLFDPQRDANPFFHLFESLWLLDGRNDVAWLDQFIGNFSARFGEEDGTLHGSYGHRWRNHFDVDGGGNENMPDQLDTVVRLLTANRSDRRVVLQMWDPVADLGQSFRDVPCNLMVVPRVRWVEAEPEPFGGMPGLIPVLDITVFNRSNDFVWGLTGANAVQFSFLQEYLAGRLGLGVGHYHQVTTNLHVYTSILEKLGTPDFYEYGEAPTPIGKTWQVWDEDLRRFMQAADDPDFLEKAPNTFPENPWFEETALPLLAAHKLWKGGKREDALDVLTSGVFRMSPDWRRAAANWMNRRMNKQEQGK